MQALGGTSMVGLFALYCAKLQHRIGLTACPGDQSTENFDAVLSGFG